MLFGKIEKMTMQELIALAYGEYAHNRFTDNTLTMYFCSLFSIKFKVSRINLIALLLKQAKDEGFLCSALGPRGGPGFQITEQGADSIGDSGVAFGKPPSMIWRDISDTNRQPDADSIQWKKLIKHPAFQSFGGETER